MTATARQWAVFVDNVNPRIVMTAQPIPDDGHVASGDSNTSRPTLWRSL